MEVYFVKYFFHSSMPPNKLNRFSKGNLFSNRWMAIWLRTPFLQYTITGIFFSMIPKYWVIFAKGIISPPMLYRSCSWNSYHFPSVRAFLLEGYWVTCLEHFAVTRWGPSSVV